MSSTAGNFSIVILAAGSSERMGIPKQLLPYRGKNFIKHAADIALDTGCESVIVVLGAYRKLIREELADKKIIIAENDKWNEGIASSIRCGLETLNQAFPQTTFVIFMVCDQPGVNKSLLYQLEQKAIETGLPVVASSYENCLGTPALFHKSFFPALMELKGDRGAQQLINDNPEKVASVYFPGGETDFDTKTDLGNLKTGN